MNKRFKKVLHATIIGLAVIAFWRGAWQLMDIYVFPSDPVLSNIVTLVVGLVILIASHKAIKTLI